MSDVDVTVVGHVGQDPAIYTAESGTRWTSIRVASTRRVRDPRTGEWGDGPTMWFTVRAFGDRALNLVESVRKGTPVVVTGRLAIEEYEVRKQEKGPDGEPVEVRAPRTAHVIENAVVGVDLSRGIARYVRTVHTGVVPPGAPQNGSDERRDSWDVPGASAAPEGDGDGDDDDIEAGQNENEDVRETVGV